MAPLRIVIVSDSGNSGGAGIAAGRLASGLRSRGNKVTRLLPHVTGERVTGENVTGENVTGQNVTGQNDSLALAPNYSGSLTFRAAGRLARAVDESWWPEYWSRTWLRTNLEKLQPDVISVHNLHGCNWPAEFLSDCMAYAPTAWTLHDCWSFTGRCVYPARCEKFLDGCDANCPTATEYPALPLAKIAPAWKRRQRVLDQSMSLIGVTPSRWLRSVAQRGLWRGHDVKVIANGLPVDVYRPGDRDCYRREMGIGAEPVLLAASQNLTDPRKGLALLLDVLRNWTSPLTLITFGSGSMPEGLPANIRLVELGQIHGEESKMRAYNMADIYAHPALEDNLPNTVAESVACGTPVVAFDVGGLAEMVVPGVTGWLAGEPGAAALADTLKRAIGSPIDRAGCRRHAELVYDLDKRSGEYEETFRDLLSKA